MRVPKRAYSLRGRRFWTFSWMARTIGEYDFCVFASQHLPGENTKTGKSAVLSSKFKGSAFSPNCAFYSQKFIKIYKNTQNLLRISSEIDKNDLKMLKNHLKIALLAPPRALNYTQSPPRAPQEPLGLLKDSPRAPQEVLGAPKRVPKRPQSLQKVPRRHPRGSVSENF